MKITKLAIRFLFIAILAFGSGCTKNDEPERAEIEAVDSEGKKVDIRQLQPGEVKVRVSEELARELESSADAVGMLSANVKSAGVINGMGIKRMTRLFPYAGKFEARTRKEGLHLWYNVEFDTEAPLTRASSELKQIDGIEIVEFVPKIVISDELVTNPFTGDFRTKAQEAASVDFNDPYFSKQWSLYNDGTRSHTVAGCDINVLPVWKKYTTGSKDVIVAVVDGGVDFNHEDLNANMWRNPDETGDKVYGWNFVTNGPLISPGNHGTHVAGIIGAVNNNKLGICGVAGGDYAKGIKGARIMSCQVFGDNSKQGPISSAIKWSADHGAVISQNSWSYDTVEYIPTYDQQAFDYFVKYAGLDESGNQVGPMAGGILFFAAGNQDKNMGYPACYEKNVAVSSVGADFTRAYYSNYGDWTDITAPGGDVQKSYQIYSTLPGNTYGNMQGTSMACPHVSGIAALVISHLGGPGFTSTKLRELLESTCRDISSYNTSAKRIANLVDAFAAVSGASTIPPEKIVDFKVSAKSNTIEYSFTVPADEDDNCASSAIIYYSKTPFTTPDNCSSITVPLNSALSGDKFSGTINNLEFNQKYYLAIRSTDPVGNQSELSDVVSITTNKNLPPQIIVVNSSNISMKASEMKYLKFKVVEPEGQSYTASLQEKMNGVSMTQLANDTLQLVINAPVIVFQYGSEVQHTFNFSLNVSDVYGETSTQVISVTILKNNPPVALSGIDNFVMKSVGEKIELNMDNYFSDPDGEQLTYSFTNDSQSIVNLNQSGNSVFVTAMSFGVANVTVRAIDAMSKSVSATFTVLVRDPKVEVDVYPQPSAKDIFLRMGEEFTGVASFYNSLGSKVKEVNVSGTPFSPAEVNISDLSAGVYTMILTANGKEIKRNIVKL